MNLSAYTIGFAMTGSYCTYQSVFAQMKALKATGANIIPIFSKQAQTTSCRFGNSEAFLQTATEICQTQPLLTIPEVEPIGPKRMLDLLVIAPCTGNTLAKLANGITDSPVLMAAKSHLRTERPLVIALASNDALGQNFKNIGLLYNTKHVYFVPMGQDNWIQKPNSLVAHMDLLLPTIQAALEEKQLQPILQYYPETY